MLEGHAEVPDRILDKAYHSLLYNNSSVSEKDKIIVRQHKYINEHGNFKVKTRETQDELICSFYLNDEKYTCKIPLEYDMVISEVYPFGDIQFKDVKLLSVSLQNQSGWANEVFNVSYWGTPVKIKQDDKFKPIEEPWVEEKMRILKQFYVPRKLNVDTAPLKECVTKNSSKNKFMTVDVRNYTKCNTPNPWIKYSMGVLYENENVAQKLFNHEGIYDSKEKYHLTPPEEMP